MAWTVIIRKRVIKQLRKLPESVKARFAALVTELEQLGPVRGSWPNYSKLPGNKHHCHLKKGKSTYVAIWEETEKGIEIEVIYVGTHEGADYSN